MLLFVGLGNPGLKYAHNRHNLGFMALNELARQYQFPAARQRFKSRFQEGQIAGQRVLLQKPETFMNESGRAVGEALRFFKLAASDVTVFYDDLDLKPGKVKIKYGGGAGGHNGLRSLDAHIGSDYRRVRIGIGHPGSKDAVLRYVLDDFAKVEQAGWLADLIPGIAGEIEALVTGDDGRFMSRLAHIVFPPPLKPPKSTARGTATVPAAATKAATSKTPDTDTALSAALARAGHLNKPIDED